MLAGMWQWQATEIETGQRLVDALAQRMPAAPRAFLRQTLRKGRVHCAGRPASADLLLACGMDLSVQASARFAELASLGGVPPRDLLFEDRHALVIYKPPGMAMHRGVGHADTLVERAARFTALRRAPYRLAPVHRLDVGTSGPVLFAKGRWAAGQYGRLLMDGRFAKYYLALAAGRVPLHGELATPVIATGRLQPALSRYRCLATSGSLSLVELELVTGRQHQARQQLAAAGWPIVGDRRYHGRPWPELAQPFLHCQRLCFPGLEDGQTRQVHCPLPPELAAILAAAGLPPAPTPGAVLENCPAAGGEQV